MKKQPTQEQSNSTLECILGQKTVGFYPVIAKALGSAPAAIMVSQAFFWQYKAKFGSPIVIDGEQYFSKTVAEWYEETSVSESAQRLARSILVKHGIMIERLAGLPASMHFRVDINALVAVINGYLSTGIAVAAKHGNKEREITRTGSGKFRRQGATKDGDILNVETSESFESEGEGTPPAPNPSNLQSQKKENGLVAPPAENPETVKAEIPPQKKVAPKKESPEKCEWCDGLGTVRSEDGRSAGKIIDCWHCDGYGVAKTEDLTEQAAAQNEFVNNLGFCGTCMGLGYLNGRNGREVCEDCDGSGNGSEMVDAAQFEVTAIASPNDIPGVTLVEAAPKTIQPWEHPNPQSPKDLKATMLRYADQNPENWRDNVLESGRATGMAKEKIDECLTDFCAWQFQEDRTKSKLSQYTAGFSLWLKRQPRYDSMNAPKEGSPTRGGQTQQPPQSALPRFLQNKIGR